MKKLYILLTLLVLASCGEAEISKKIVENTPTKAASQEIWLAMEGLWEEKKERPEGREDWGDFERPELAEWEERPERQGWEDFERPELAEWETRPQRWEEGWRRGRKWPEPVVEATYEGWAITEEEKSEGNVVELSTTYISPKTEVIMNVNYTLDENEKFSKIEVTSPNYTHMSKFNNGIQNVIWMTIEEASEYNVAWSTLGWAAFYKVLKAL